MGEKICKTSFTPEPNELACLKSLVQNVTSNGACISVQTPVVESPPVVADQGMNGLLINCPDSFTVISHSGEHLERITNHMTSSHPDRRICAFAPARYSMVTVKNLSYEENILQGVSTSVTFNESVSELSSYFVSNNSWSSTVPENLTMHSLERMFREKYFNGVAGSGFSVEMIGFSALLLLLIVLGLYVFALHQGYLRKKSPAHETHDRQESEFSHRITGNRDSYWRRMRNRSYRNDKNETRSQLTPLIWK